MLGSQDEQRERPVKILSGSNCSYTVRITIGQVVLSVRMTPIGESFQESCSFFDEILAFLLVDGRKRSCGGGQVGMGLAVRSGVGVERFRSFDHEDGEFEDEFRVVGLFRIFSVELEGLFVGKQSCLFTGSKMGCERSWHNRY